MTAAFRTRTYLKKVFWPKLGVGRSVQVLEILQYSSGLNLASALILNQNPFFEIGSNLFNCDTASEDQNFKN